MTIAVPRPDPAGMEADVFAPAPPPFAWRSRTRRRPENLTLAQALNRGLRKILDGAARVDRPRPGHRDLWRRVQGDRGPLRRFRPRAGLQYPAGRERLHRLRDRPRAQRAPPDRGVPVRRLRHRGHDPDHAQRGHDAFPLRRRAARSCCGCPAAAASRLGSFHSQELESLLPLDARDQGPLPEQPPGRVQRGARRLRGRQPGAPLRAQGPLPARQAPGRLGSRLPATSGAPARCAPGTTPPSSPTGRWSSSPPRSATTSPPNTRPSIELFDLRCLSPARPLGDHRLGRRDPPPHRPARGPADPRLRRRDGGADHRGLRAPPQGAARCGSPRSTCPCRSPPNWRPPSGPPGTR